MTPPFAALNVAVLSKNALRKDFLTGEEYVVAVDILRNMIERVLKSVDDIAENGHELRFLPRHDVAVATDEEPLGGRRD